MADEEKENQFEQQGLWAKVEERAKEARAQQPAQDLWTTLREKLDFSKLKPKGVSTVEISKQQFRGEERFILHNTKTDTYLQLDPRGFFLWNLMDGRHSLTDLAIAYLNEYGSPPFEQLSSLLTQLKSNGFLEEKTPNLYVLIWNRFGAKSFKSQLERVWKKVSQAQISINADRYFDWIYRHGGWLFFSPPAMILFIILSVVGIPLFIWEFIRGDYPLFQTAGSYGLGILTLLLLNIVILFIHEHGHGLTVKFYGRKIISGGIMLYWGTPCMFVDTTDMWLGTRKQRIAVSWAGPYAGLIIGSVCAILIALFPSSAMAPFLFQAAFLGMLNVLVNMNPLLEWDGYYILVNYLEIPGLRAKSFEFIKGPLWQKLSRREKFNREEKIFTAFGIMAAIWAVVAILLLVDLWHSNFQIMFNLLWGNWIGKVILILIGLIILIPLVGSMGVKIWNGVRDAWNAIRRRKQC